MASDPHRDFAAAYLRLARKLGSMNVPAAPHISRQDNDRCFEMAWELRRIAQRVKDQYSPAKPRVRPIHVRAILKEHPDDRA